MRECFHVVVVVGGTRRRRVRARRVIANANADAASDDGNGDGGPSVNIAFVTSTSVQISTLGGHLGADALCAQRAEAGGLPSNTYVAWLSTSTVDAKTRLAGARGWVRPDGLPFADTLESPRGGSHRR